MDGQAGRGEGGWDERCVVCYPDAKCAEGEDGFDHFCKDHNPPRDVMLDHLTGDDGEALDRWIEEAQQEVVRE